MGVLLGFGVLLLIGRMIWYTNGAAHPQFTAFSLGPPTMLFLVWNLFLAWLPYELSGHLTRRRRADVVAFGLLGLWLLFLPNAPYILTDFVHLRSRPPIPWWYDLLLLSSYATLGIWLGLRSLQRVYAWLSSQYHEKVATLVVAVSLWLTGFGVYIGRFGRWNSWDVFTQPASLIYYFEELAAQPAEPLVFTLLWGGFLNVLYFIFGKEKQRRGMG